MSKTNTKTKPSKILPRAIAGVTTDPRTSNETVDDVIESLPDTDDDDDDAPRVVESHEQGATSEPAPSPYDDDKAATTRHGFALVRAAAVGGVDEVERVLLMMPARIRARAVAIAAKHDIDGEPYRAALARVPTSTPRVGGKRDDTRSVRYGKPGAEVTPFVVLRVAYLDVVRGDRVRLIEGVDDEGRKTITITKA